MDPRNIPGCTYCHPQIASVGLTEAKAKEAGYEVKVGNFPFIGNGKAIALGEAEGFVKTVFDAKTGELLGAHMIGAEVTELIQGYVVGKTLETTEAELMETVFPHPTLSEMMHESVLAAYGRALHICSRSNRNGLLRSPSACGRGTQRCDRSESPHATQQSGAVAIAH